MSASEAIQPSHLERLALVYVRQSSPHQVLANQESLKLQYDLQHRACAAGWDQTQVRIIDSDLGRTGRTAEGRRGFQDVGHYVERTPKKARILLGLFLLQLGTHLNHARVRAASIRRR